MKTANAVTGMGSLAVLAVLGIALFSAGCAGGDARFPKRPEGCEVTVYHLNPEVPTENIGPVHAACSEDVNADACLRTFKDAVCNLGGDVVWGVDDPEKKDGKLHYNGRAAHTKPAKARPKPPPGDAPGASAY
jgi:hypothetical protein